MVLFPIFAYVLLLAPFLGLVPSHDGNNEFKVVYNFYQGSYLSNWISYHPPFKLWLFSNFFHIFGIRSYSYVGIFFGLIGILALYFSAKKLFDTKVALLSSLFLATSGAYIANGLFSLNDFLVTIFILCAFYFYTNSQSFLYGICAALAVLVKESAIVFPLAVFLVDLVRIRKISVSNLLPFIAFQGWLWYLFLAHHSLWNDWNFSSTSSQGSIFTIAYNLITLHFFNKYLFENLLHLFVFNFNWIFTLLILSTLPLNWRKVSSLKKSRPFLVITVTVIFYSIVVFSFQTYTINRYILPLLPFLYLFAAYCLSKLRFNVWLTLFVFAVICVSLFTSVDPISNRIWAKYYILGDGFYLGPIDGPDGMTYNLQFLEFARKRDKIVATGNCKPFLSQLDYDPKTFALYSLPGCTHSR